MGFKATVCTAMVFDAFICLAVLTAGASCVCLL